MLAVIDPDQLSVGLPTMLTSLVGRGREIAALRALLRDDAVRLITLTGPGGVGKTRLALRVAEESAADFPEGVAFVPLAPIHDPALLLPTIAHTLGVREAGEASLAAALVAALRGRLLLLVLDNLEHVLAGAPRIAGLLAACPTLTALATSRAPLRLSGEREFPVPPLRLPDAPEAGHPRPPVSALAATEAVGLFVERATAVRPGFVLDDENAATVAEICRRLDCLPLAIELASAQLRHFQPPALLARLERRLPLLTGGARDAPARHRTMRRAIVWSHDLLSADEQAAFRRLAVFVGGFTLDAAEDVVASTENREPSRTNHSVLGSRLSALDLVAALVEASLLRREEVPAGEPRYAMLETVREFGLEALAAEGEEEAVRQQHAAHFLDLAERADAATGRKAVDWLDRLERDYDNLQAAIAWLEQAGDTERLLRLAGAMVFFWFYRGRLREGRRVLERAFAAAARDPATPADRRAYALSQAGVLASVQGDVATSTAWLSEAVRLAAAVANTTVEVVARGRLGGVLVGEGRYDEAAPMFAANLDRARELGVERWWVAHAEFHLGIIAHAQGDAAAARPLLRAAAARYERVSNRWDAVDPLRYLGLIACAEGDTAGAATLFADILSRLRVGGSRQAIATTLADVATLAAATGKPHQAAQLFGAADALRETEGTSFSLPARDRYDAARTGAQAALGAARFQAANADGRVLALEPMLALAEGVLASAAGATAAPAERAPTESDLTTRELDVLRLLVAGHTNQEIADALFVSRGTVRTHVSNILAKFGAKTRTEAVTIAHQRGIVA